jgi:nitrogen fixation/metabolism regulation signal transduction histidine kinase
MSAALLVLLLFPMQLLTSNGMKEMTSLSVDTDLGPVLVSAVQHSEGEEKEAAVRSLERFRQWRVAAPLIAKEQRLIAIGFSLLLIIFLLLIYAVTLRRLTRPLKKLSAAATAIGQNKRPDIKISGGGAVGALEKAMSDMAIELDKHRAHLLTEGMEKAWRDMARIMAHEIKNPLTPIRLSLDRLDEKVASGSLVSKEEWCRFSDRVGIQLDQLERLVSSFSSFAKEPEVRSINLDPRTVLERIAEGFKGHITINFHGAAEALADPLLLQQIGLNIIKNSVEAGATSMEITVEENSKDIEINFHDNGPGVPKSEAEKIFIPYITSKSGGTGLGLAVVKRLVESMHGKVLLPENSGKGLLIKLCLQRSIKK